MPFIIVLIIVTLSIVIFFGWCVNLAIHTENSMYKKNEYFWGISIQNWSIIGMACNLIILMVFIFTLVEFLKKEDTTSPVKYEPVKEQLYKKL
jgi:hypothetical protein